MQDVIQGKIVGGLRTGIEDHPKLCSRTTRFHNPVHREIVMLSLRGYLFSVP